MKKFALIPALMLFIQLNLQSQWVVKNVDTTYEVITEMKFFGDQIGIAVGISGLILKSNDAGETWNKIDSPFYGDIYDVTFLSEDTIFLVTGCKIYKSTDGGVQWEEKYSSVEGSLNCIQFINSNEGFATGNRSIYKTINGGETWFKTFEINPFTIEFGDITSIDMVNSTLGYAVEIGFNPYGFLLKTENGGYDWQIVDEFDDMRDKIDFFDEELGFMSSSDYTYRTTNGGMTWDTLHNLFGVVDFSIASSNSIISVNIPSGYIVPKGRPFAISKSHDSGNTWDGAFTNGAHLETVFFLNDSIGFVGGEYAIIMKTETCGGEIIGNYPWHLFINPVIETDKIQEIKINPNPCTNLLSIENDALNADNAFYTVSGIDGRIKAKGTINHSANEIDVSLLPEGIYFLQIKDELTNKISVGKFLKIQEN